ncbi:MAG: efflux RND transporter permease subunit, partial [Polyangia bacterium]
MFVEFFIRRPVFATVCALLIVLGGAISIPTLPVGLYPDLAPPQVTVTSVYTGANAETVESAVTTPLEEGINGVEGMRYLSSTSGNNGVSTITVTFDTGYSLDIAAVDVQNRVATALARLPNEVKQTGVTVSKSSNAIVLAVGLSSENNRYSNLFISNYADVYLRDDLLRLPGISDVRIFGERRYAMRLWLDPARLAARGLTAPDVVHALQDQNLEIAAGNVGQPPSPSGQTYQISVRAVGRLTDPKQFAEVVLKAGADGSLVKVKDVGSVELGAEDYSSELRFDRRTAVGLGVFQLPDANALDVDREVRAELKRLSREFPPGLTYKPAFDTTTVIGESIDEVLVTLAIAILLVIAVIFIFLQTWRSTVIPAITIPVSLVGTFIFVRAFGFSINTLTLFGLTLATGLVV